MSERMQSESGDSSDANIRLDDVVARRLRKIATLLGVGVVIAAVIGFAVVLTYVNGMRDREVDQWRERLLINADMRALSMDQWVRANAGHVETIAKNATIAFYLTELSVMGDPQLVTDGQARLDIIRTYLTFSAEQGKFLADPAGPNIAANLDRPRRGGLALVGLDGRLISATDWMPKYDAVLQAFQQRDPSAKGVFVHPPYKGEAGELTVALVAPVYGLEGEEEAPLAYVVGVKLATALDARLQSTTSSGPIETLLMRPDEDRLVNVMRPEDSLPRGDLSLAVVEASEMPGSFVRGLLGSTQVLANASRLKTVPWIAVSTVDAKTALRDIYSRRNATLIIFGLTIICLAAAALLFWRYGASIRTAAEAERARLLAGRYERLSKFLRSVSDAQPTMIVTFDLKGRCRFANKRASEYVNLDEDISGKTARAIFGQPLGPEIAASNSHVLEKGHRVTKIHQIELAGGEQQTLRAEHLPLADAEDEQDGVLLVLEDITELEKERQRREHNLSQLVRTLTGVIDSRDPYSARQSRWVSEVSGILARDMGLDPVMVETAEVAGALLNLGKVTVPKALLTRTGSLTPDELDIIRQSLTKSADLLEGVEFNGPVVATLGQAQAHLDGSGIPQGLKGDQILVSARILAVANAFVGMVSARAHRAPLPLDTVLGKLLGAVGEIYDRRPVAALVNYLENHGGRAIWEERARETMD